MACEAQSIADVKMEQMEPDSASAYSEPHPVSGPHPLYPQPDTSVLNYFLTLRTNVEQTSQILTDTWGQLSGLLDTYKAQLFNAESINIQPGHDDLMKLLMTKEQENGRLREELRLFNERYDSDIGEREQRIQNFQTEILTLKRQKDSLTLSVNQKTRRFENKIRVLEGKLEKSEKGMKTPHGKGAKWSGRPSGRLLPGAGLVERTPTPTQVARVTPVPTPEKLVPAHSDSAHSSVDHAHSSADHAQFVDQYAIKTESSSETGSSKTDGGAETYMTVQPTEPPNYVTNTSQGAGNYSGLDIAPQAHDYYPVGGGDSAPVAISNQTSTEGLVLPQEVALEQGRLSDVIDDVTDDDVTDDESLVHEVVTSEEMSADYGQLLAEEMSTSEEILDDYVAESSQTPEKRERKWFSCDQCDYKSATRYCLQRHQNVHKNVRFHCPQCPKFFRSAYYRNLHVSSHDANESGHLCHVCAKTFVCKDSLTQHMALHEEKFKCTECGQVLGSSAKLRNHSKIHTREPQTTFECSKCGKSFSSRDIRRRHSKSCGIQNYFQCEDCGKLFTLKRTLEKHTRVLHGTGEAKMHEC